MLVALDLDSLKSQPLYRVPEGYAVNIANVTADGRYVCTNIYEDLSARFKVDLPCSYPRFEEMAGQAAIANYPYLQERWFGQDYFREGLLDRTCQHRP